MISEFRLSAFKRSMKTHGFSLLPELYASSSYSAGADPDTVLSLINNGATAIMCGSDIIAYSVIRACNALNISIPDDISLVGYDDLPASAATNPALTTIRQDRLMIGKSGYYTLYSIIRGVSLSRNLIRPTLVERNSTSPPKCLDDGLVVERHA